MSSSSHAILLITSSLSLASLLRISTSCSFHVGMHELRVLPLPLSPHFFLFSSHCQLIYFSLFITFYALSVMILT
ncbi:hypothetical protein F5Y14DRAFT_138022 [Nemania sp. NC0429]|nr:hypothetical protein F5Y14DRAFT_138022 [Nemania sp. NC0429]